MNQYVLNRGVSMTAITKALPRGGEVIVAPDYEPVEESVNLGAGFDWLIRAADGSPTKPLIPFLNMTAVVGRQFHLSDVECGGLRRVTEEQVGLVAMRRCRIVRGTGDAVNVTARARTFSGGLEMWDSEIESFSPTKGQGVYADGLSYVEVKRSLIDRRGCPPSGLNHAVYAQRGVRVSCASSVILGGPSHAIQCRGSFALVDSVLSGSACGVLCSGHRGRESIICNNFFLDGQDLGDNSRCWGIEVLPQSRTEIRDNIFGRAVSRDPRVAFAVRYSPAPKDDAAYPTPSEETHIFTRNRGAWPGGVRWWRDWERPSSVEGLVPVECPSWSDVEAAGVEWRGARAWLTEQVKEASK